MRSANCFSFAFGTPCSRHVQCYCLAFIFTFPSMMSCPPRSGWHYRALRDQDPISTVFVWELGRTSSTSSLGANAYGCCGPRSLSAHVPFIFFFYFALAWRLGQSLNFKACQRVCTCDKGPYPPSLGFYFLRDHLNFASFPPFSSTFPCFDSLLDFIQMKT